MTALAELQHMERVVTTHLGHYNGAVTWFLQHRPNASAEQVAEILTDRDGPAVRKMTDHSGWICDREEWYPILLAAVSAMLEEIAVGP